MDSTTLVAFRFKTSLEVHNVELFGSWDNFANGYRMEKDAHKGRGNWTGCHRFKNIIYDGAKSDWSRPRSGALKQGGKYWYYYKLDDQDEQHDPAQPCTSTCPLLPGQTVNVIEIPIEVIAPPQRTSSAGATMTTTALPVMSLDPADRFKKIYRKHPTKLPRFYCSSDALRDRAESPPSSSIMESGGPVRSPPSTKQQSSHRILKRVRGSRAQPQQQPVPYLSRPTSAEAEALLQSIATTIPELNRLPTLRPFGPTPDYLTASENERPSTRHGSAEDRPFGFNQIIDCVSDVRPSSRRGINGDQTSASRSTSGYVPEERPSTGHGSAVGEPIGLGITFPVLPGSGDHVRPPHSPSIYSSLTGEPNWPFRNSDSVTINSVTPGPVSLSSGSRNFSPGGSEQPISPLYDAVPFSSFDERRGTGIFDMLSPTFTAATMSSVDDHETPTDNFQLDDYMGQDYTSAWLASTQSPPRHTLAEAEAGPVKRQSRVFSGKNNSSATLLPSPRLQDGHQETRNVSEYTSFPEFVPSRPATVESEVQPVSKAVGPPVEGGDFAKEVFGALGFRKLGWF